MAKNDKQPTPAPVVGVGIGLKVGVGGISPTSPGAGNADLDVLRAQLLGTAPQASGSSYDAIQDIYGLGVRSDTPVGTWGPPPQSEIVRSLGTPQQIRTMGTVGGQIQRIYRMKPAEISAWQAKLYEGGFYPASYKPEDITPGVVDGATAQAWETAVMLAARATAAGQNTSLEDVILESAQALGYTGPGGGGGGAAYQPTRLSDPATLRSMADQISASLIGRKLTDMEKQKIVDQIHAAETGFYGSVRAQAGTLTEVDPQARIQESIQESFRNEYEATNVANTYDMFDAIIRGSRR